MQEWTSGNEFSTRIANLSGTGSGGVNNEYHFKTRGPDATVFNDDAADTLTGAAGWDWFLLDDEQDRVTDVTDKDFANAVDLVLSDL